MPIQLQRIKLLDHKTKKAEFSVVLSDGKNQVILPKLVAVAGSRGIFVAPPGKSIKDKEKGTWKDLPNFYLNKLFKDEIERQIIQFLSDKEKTSNKNSKSSKRAPGKEVPSGGGGGNPEPTPKPGPSPSGLKAKSK